MSRTSTSIWKTGGFAWRWSCRASSSPLPAVDPGGARAVAGSPEHAAMFGLPVCEPVHPTPAGRGGWASVAVTASVRRTGPRTLGPGTMRDEGRSWRAPETPL